MWLGTNFLKCRPICGFAKLCSFSLLTNSYLTCDNFGAPGKGQVYQRWESLITMCAFHMLSFGTSEHHIVSGSQAWSDNTFHRKSENSSYMPVYLKICEKLWHFLTFVFLPIFTNGWDKVEDYINLNFLITCGSKWQGSDWIHDSIFRHNF